MIKYIIRELKTACKSKMFLILLACIVGICLLANCAVMAFTLIYGSEIDGVMGSNVLSFATWCFPIPYLACIFIAHLIFGPVYPNPHIKDNITKNLSRTKIYLGKFISALIVALVFMVFAVVVLLITTRIFHSDITSYDVSTFLSNMLVAIPLWIASVAIGMMCLFSFENKKKAYIVFYVITLVVPRIIMFFAAEPFSLPPFIAVRKILMSQSFTHIPYLADPARNVNLIVGEGIVYTVIACVIGIVIYNKRDKKA